MKPKRSEFEGDGVRPFGFFGIERAMEKLRFAMRVEQDPDSPIANINAPADKFEHGGVESLDDYNLHPGHHREMTVPGLPHESRSKKQ